MAPGARRGLPRPAPSGRVVRVRGPAGLPTRVEEGRSRWGPGLPSGVGASSSSPASGRPVRDQQGAAGGSPGPGPARPVAAEGRAGPVAGHPAAGHTRAAGDGHPPRPRPRRPGPEAPRRREVDRDRRATGTAGRAQRRGRGDGPRRRRGRRPNGHVHSRSGALPSSQPRVVEAVDPVDMSTVRYTALPLTLSLGSGHPRTGCPLARREMPFP